MISTGAGALRDGDRVAVAGRTGGRGRRGDGQANGTADGTGTAPRSGVQGDPPAAGGGGSTPLRAARGQVMQRHPAGETSPVAKALAAAVAVMAAVALEAARGAKGVALVETAVDDAGVTARPSRRVV